MKESIINIHFGIYQLAHDELHCLRYFPRQFEREWLNSEFAKYCIEKVDKCKYLGGILIDSPWLGPIPPERLSGSTQVLLMAYNQKNKIYPLEFVGSDCGEALYMSGINGPTQWGYMDYAPTFVPEQKIYVVDRDEIVLGKDWPYWAMENAPDPIDLVPGLREDIEAHPDEEMYANERFADE